MSAKARKGVDQAGGYRRLLRWAALPVTDRRWAAPLSAVALGFGLFVGVAIGPGAAGTFATGPAQIIEIPSLISGEDDGEESESAPVASSPEPFAGGGESAASETALPSFASSEPEDESSEPEPGPSKPKKPAKEEEEVEPEEQTLAGVVIHVNPAAGSYTLAEPGGTLDVLHAGKPPQPGTEASVPVRLLSNGTFAEAGKRKKTGTRDRATFSGIVTYVDPTATAPAYTVSKRGASVLVHVHPDPAGAPPTLPALGAFASVAVDIEKVQPPTEPALAPGPIPAQPAEATPPAEPAPAAEPSPAPSCAPDPSTPLPAIQPSAVLWQRQVSAPGAPYPYSDFAGIVSAVCPDSEQLLISADDVRESGHDLLFAVGDGIDPSKVEVGQSVLAMADIGADGSLELTGLASDQRTKGAEDAKSAQGKLVPSKPK